MRAPTALALALALASLLAAPPAVSASTASVESVPRFDEPIIVAYHVTVRGAPGEANDILVEPVAGDSSSVRVVDAGARLEPGPACERVGEHEVRCQAVPEVKVEAGDGDDRVRVALRGGVDGGSGADVLTAAVGGGLFGGEGDDRLTALGAARLDGGPGDDHLAGSGAPDTLAGGGGRDVLVAGEGDDALADADAPAAPGPDVLDGGGGIDRVEYLDRIRPVVLTLPDAGEGEAGEGDAIRSIESAAGGSAGDTLTGTDESALLWGNDGDDRIAGNGGDDEIQGGNGDDTVDGGAGDDRLIGDPGADALAGGLGDDTLEGGRGDDALNGDAGDDALYAEAGANRLRGGPGRDRLYGGEMGELLDGGPGPDDIVAFRNHFADQVRCGGGRDTVRFERGDALSHCEDRRAMISESPRAIGDPDVFPPAVTFSQGRGALRLLCRYPTACPAKVTGTVRDGRRRVTVLRATLTCERCGGGSAGDARLTRAGRRLLRERGRLRARATVVFAPGREGGALPFSRALLLRAGRR